MKRIILFTLSFWVSLFCLAEVPLHIKGRIYCKHAPVEFANVVLQTKDSIFVSGGITDRQGHFSLSQLAAGDYQLIISSLGYSTKRLMIETVCQSRDLGEIELDSACVTLDEIVVKASYIINQADKKIVLPTAHQLKAASNGVNLLDQMKLSRLQVDPMRNTITSSNEGEVQLRINGAKAEIQEIQALRPEEVQRIEYHDDPGLRYGTNVAAVIDYITKRKSSGGYIGVHTQNSPHTGFGDNALNLKLNHKKSELKIGYRGMYRDFNGYWRKNLESFNLADGSTFVRKEDGTPNRLSENYHYLNVSYNYQEGEKWFFNTTLRYGYNKSTQNSESQLYSVNNPQKSVYMLDKHNSYSHIPTLDLYFHRNYVKRQTVILNLVGTINDSQENRDYTETKDSQTLTDISSQIEGNKHSFIAEAIYEKGIGRKDKLSLGTHYYQTQSDNTYSGTVNSKNELKKKDLWIYAEYTGQIGKINYAGGANFSYFRIKQGIDSYDKAVVFPRLRLTYQFSNDAFLRLNSKLSYQLPELSELSDVEQLIDSLQLRRGNPNLKEYATYSNSLYFEYRKGLFSGNINLLYQFQDRPIMEETLRQDNRFIRTTDNQRSWQKLNPELELKVGPLKDILTLSASTGINYFDSKGNNYHHTYLNWYYSLMINASYKNFNAAFRIQNHRNDFYGETLTYGESYHILSLGYRFKHLNVGVLTLNPFAGKNSYNRPTENHSHFAPSRNTWYVRESAQLYAVTLSWNFSFGRSYQSKEKRLNNEDTDTSTLKSGK